jgi:hypothetical protein
LGPHVIKAKADSNNQLGEVNENNNDGTSTIEVKKAAPPATNKNDSSGMLYTLASVALICVAVGVAYVVVTRRPKYDKELYESIYGKKGDMSAQDAQLAAERAEVERRAREKSSEMPAASYGYEAPVGLTEEDYAPQPSGTPAEPAYAAGVTLDMGQTAPSHETPQPPTPPSEPTPPAEPERPAAPGEPKKKITIRPVK